MQTIEARKTESESPNGNHSIGLGAETRSRLILAAILAVGAFLRLHKLATVPQGLLYDEAFNGLDVLTILGGERPIFLAGNYGREALFIYLQTISVAIFGRSDFALHLVSAMIGVLTIAASYPLLRRLFDRRVAILSCCWLASSLWQVVFSRIGLRAVSLPLFEAVAFYCFWRAWSGHDTNRVARLGWYVLSGLGLGITLYTYTAGRFAPLVLVVFAVYVALWHSKQTVATIRGLALTGLVAFGVFLPQALFFAENPEAFTMRAGAVSVFNPVINQGDVTGTLLTTSLRIIGMFSFAGDNSWDRNVAGRPVFDPVSSLLFALGLMVCLRHWRKPANAFVVLWFATMLVPGILSPMDVPNYLREIGVVPAVFAFPAIGFAWVADRWKAERSPSRQFYLPIVVAIAGFAAGSLITCLTYFGIWARAPQVLDSFGGDRWLAIQNALALSAHERVYLAAGEKDDLVAHYGFGGAPPAGIRMFNGSQSLVLPRDGESAAYVFPSSRSPERTLLLRAFPGGPETTSSSDAASVSTYRLSSARRPLTPQTRLDVRFGDSLRLIGYDLPQTVRAGESASMIWYWEILSPDGRDLVFFHHLLDTKSRSVGQYDSRVLPAGYWEGGTRGLSFFSIGVDAKAPTGAHWLSIGVYDQSTLARLPVFSDQGQSIGDQVRLGPIKVRGTASQMPAIRYELRDVRFSDSVSLLGYDLDWREDNGQTKAMLTLFWQAVGRPSHDYTVFVHLLDSEKRLLTQSDGPPAEGSYPTSFWDDGEIIVDKREIALERTVDTGSRTIFVGLYDPKTGLRLKLIDDRGSTIGDGISLPTAR